MDDRWESEISEYGAINITGFRIVDTNRRYVKDFLDGWKRLDPVTSVGAGKESISVSCVLCVLSHHSTIDVRVKIANHFHYDSPSQAQAALMYDAVFVLVEAFNKLLRKKPDQFRSYTMRRMGQMPPAPVTNTTHPNANNANAQTNRVLDCNTSKGWVNPWEHGDKISRYLRKVFHICPARACPVQ